MRGRKQGRVNHICQVQAIKADEECVYPDHFIFRVHKLNQITCSIQLNLKIRIKQRDSCLSHVNQNKLYFRIYGFFKKKVQVSKEKVCWN